MKRICQLSIIALLLLVQTLQAASAISPSAPDSAYIFAYATPKNGGHNGLHFAWSTDRKHWNAVGPEMRFLFSDYGRWGAEKRMIDPFLFQDKNHLWHCVWSLNEREGVFAHAYSTDLVYWYPQIYPQTTKDGTCQQLEVSYNSVASNYVLSWLSKSDQLFGTTTTDFKTFAPAKSVPTTTRINARENVTISDNKENGTVHKVAWEVVEGLLAKKNLEDFKRMQNNESVNDDAVRFKDLKPLEAKLTVHSGDTKKISDMLIGIFFEDINYAADGGLYAELIQNRDFEYALSDKEGRDKNWNSTKAWSLKGNGATFTIDTVRSIHKNNAHFALLNITTPGAALSNEGFDGIALKAGDKYNFSFYVRHQNAASLKIAVRLVDKAGETVAQTTLTAAPSADWKKLTAILTPSKAATDAHLEIIPQSAGTVALDMISLFPQKTFKNRPNGLRQDLAQTIADLHPRFMRFPGGCVSHGDGLGNIYRWKNSVGALESRTPMRNLWGYHQSMGLGYYEYFQFCEDIGAQPVPVLAAGVPCQNSATGGAGQQGGIPMCDMQSYVQDVLDLIEWANGDATTKWGQIRIKSGHPKPFNLKYVGIGNEDLINDIFEERFTIIYNAVKSKHPEITVIGTVGPSFEGTDYVEGWKIANKLHVPIVDEHYYQSAGWFINNNDFYDKYDRAKTKVYLGEYASWGNTLYNALAEAHYLTAIERNGDVVSMTSYAPMLAKEGHTQWNPDMIYFNNSEVKPTVNYYVQQLYGQNSGDKYVANTLTLKGGNADVAKRVVSSVVVDSKSGDAVVKLVNLLPVAVTTVVQLDNAAAFKPQAELTVLAGAPADKKLQPQTSFVTVSDQLPCTLSPYSFTVIRLKAKASK